MAKQVIVHQGNGGATQPMAAENISVAPPSGSLVSIIIPCCGMLEYTKLCVPSVLRYSRPQFELIFLDIGSLDGTAEYLAGLQTGCPVRIEIVRTQTDLGISAACKDALAQARGEYIVFLNNDTVVVPGWLNQLISLSGSAETIGLVGPMSNHAAPPQLIEETVPYRIGPRKQRSEVKGPRPELVDVAAVEAFARQFATKHKGKCLSTDRLGGFCLLVKRQLLKRIEQSESLQQWSDLGLFDTDILSVKARQYGFGLAICRDLFIHHFGTRTFASGAPKADGKPPDGQGR